MLSLILASKSLKDFEDLCTHKPVLKSIFKFSGIFLSEFYDFLFFCDLRDFLLLF